MDMNRPLSTVMPALNGDVLAVLARAEDAMTTGDVRTALGWASGRGIRKVLDRLAEEGIVSRRRAGNAWLYRLEREHLAAGAIAELANLRTTFLRKLEELLGSWWWPPLYAGVVGPMAGQPSQSIGPTAGVDIVLVRPREAPGADWTKQVQGLVDAVEKWTGDKPRLAELGWDQLRGEEWAELLRAVLSDGATVYGQLEQLKRSANLAGTGRR